MTSTIWAVASAALVLAAAGCTTVETTPSATVTTLMPDAARWFKISWDVQPERGDTRKLRGYIENTYGEPAGRIQLLGQALNATGAVVGQKITWLPFAIAGFGRAYYEIPGMPAADHYRVTVWSYERIQGRDGFVFR